MSNLSQDKDIDLWIDTFKQYPRKVQIESWVTLLERAKKAFARNTGLLRKHKDRTSPDSEYNAYGYDLIIDSVEEDLRVIFKNIYSMDGHVFNGAYIITGTDYRFGLNQHTIDDITSRFKAALL